MINHSRQDHRVPNRVPPQQRSNHTPFPWGGRLQEGQAGEDPTAELVLRVRQTGRTQGPAG